MISKVVYKGDLRTESTHLQSGKTIITDAPVDNQGKGKAFFTNGFSCYSISILHANNYGNYCKT